jgi:hypothetical protein
MSGTHEPDPRDRVPVSGGPCAAGRAGTTEASLKRNAGGSRTHYQPLCRRPPHRLAPVLDAFQEFQKCPRQDSNLVLDLRRVACDPPHSEDVAHLSCEYPAEDSNLVWQLRTLPCVHHTRRASFARMSRPGFEPGPGPSEGPMRSVTPSRPISLAHHLLVINQGRRLDSHQHHPVYPCHSVYKTGGAFLFRTTSAVNDPCEHEREESNPVKRFWRPPALPGAHSCKPTNRSPWAVHRKKGNQLSSGTFQYASLINFDQLIIRSLVRA